MKELQSLGLSVELENDASEDLDLSDQDIFFGQVSEVEDPLALLEGVTNNQEEEESSGSIEEEGRVSTSSIPTDSDSTPDELSESSETGTADDEQPLTGGDS